MSLMKDGDCLHDYFCNILEIVNQIRKYSKRLLDEKAVGKFLRSLAKNYNHVVSVIEESKDLSILTIDELLGSLQSHEEKMKRYEETFIENAFQIKLQFSKDKVGGKDKESSNKRSHGEHSYRGRRSKRSGIGGSGGGHSSNHYQNEFGEKGESYNHKSIQCYYCKKFDHIEKYCRLKEKHVKFVEE